MSRVICYFLIINIFIIQSSICLKELAALAQKVENEVDGAEKELETPM